MNDSDMYAGDYVTSTYGKDVNIRDAFERITAFTPDKSDNYQRVQRVNEFIRSSGSIWAKEEGSPSVLDVGSGLCVFLHVMKAAAWDGTALDPDPRAVHHACKVVGVKAVCGDFMTTEGLGRYDLITFNKVLEHVSDPVAMLKRSRIHLRKGGFVYIEVPDGEAAWFEGPNREEFFIEHLHVFSPASLVLLASRSEFVVPLWGRLREPSNKLTLWAFLVPKPTPRRNRRGQ